jgi:hypothetical protein
VRDAADDPLPFLKALAHESRLRLLGLVAERERSVQQLAAAIEVTEPTASHHLAMLREQGLVSRRVEGNTHWYGFEPDALRERARALFSREGVASLAHVRPARGSSEAVLANYLDADGRLTQIPARRKKRRVVLAWLVEMFEDGRRYPEREVNAIIGARHWDTATLRRELIINRMLAREEGEYWRLPREGWAPEDGGAPPG